MHLEFHSWKGEKKNQQNTCHNKTELKWQTKTNLRSYFFDFLSFIDGTKHFKKNPGSLVSFAELGSAKEFQVNDVPLNNTYGLNATYKICHEHQLERQNSSIVFTCLLAVLGQELWHNVDSIADNKPGFPLHLSS